VARDIDQWLQGLGLSKYSGLFAENEIGLDVLPDLTEADLKDLGIPLGDRKRLLKSIASFSDRPAESSPPEARPAPSVEAERRQLTVMFCDLVGSTELSRLLDPEDLREVMRRYQDAVAGAVTSYEGYVAKFLGDGVLAYFGWPQAHEDQAERAVRTGLDAVAAVAKLKLGNNVALQARVGIATGQVVVGDLVGEVSAEAEAVAGETPNLAARLQGVAAPGQVVIGATTRLLIGETFDLEDLGTHELKGFAEPVAAWHVVGERRSVSRFETRHTGEFTSFVGRRDELDLLTRRWDQAVAGEGQVVLISGEPGIGKSRIAEMIHQRLPAERHLRLLYQCSPHHTNSALYPVIEQLNLAAGLGANETEEDKLDKLEKLISQATDDVSAIAPLFADLLSIRQNGRYPALNLTPQAQKERTLEGLVAQLVGLAARSPVLFVFEDLHWADPTTRELLDLTVAGIEEARVLALFTFRPEYEAPWVGQAHTTFMALTRLAKRQCGEMVRQVAADAELSEEVLNEIVAKTDGVPLFVEELTKTMVAGDSAAVPATIQASLTARLDRLGRAREVAQVGAVIGRSFADDLLAAVWDSDPEALDEALRRLVDAELLFQRGTPPDARYTFKHALLQDAAYESLLKGKRQRLHGRIANALEGRFPERTRAEPELLAHHYTEADSAEQAIAYWQKAGDRALERSANVEAIAHLQKGIELIETMPESPERAKMELELQIALGPALMITKGMVASEVSDAYSRAWELSRAIGDDRHYFTALWGLWHMHELRADWKRALELADEMMAVAQRQEDTEVLLEAHHSLWSSHHFLGNLDLAREHCEKGWRLYNRDKHSRLALVYGGHDPGVCSRQIDALSLALLGFPEQALDSVREALNLAREIDHPPTLATVHFFSAMLHQSLRDGSAALEHANAAVSVSGEYGILPSLQQGRILRGWATADQGDPLAGLAELNDVLKGARAKRRKRTLVPYYFMLLADAYGRQAAYEEALIIIAEAVERAADQDEWQWVGELHRLQGEILLAQSAENQSEAEDSFSKALEFAQRQSAKSLELRAAMSLARLWRDQSRAAKARDLLAPIYGWFTEGFDTPDLKDANALLDELS
jgi:predicted ATPase/class 3 adenylate cyclase